MRYLFIILILCHAAHASISVLNFNTMCDICKGSHFSTYSHRLSEIQKIIHKYQADLISLQELRLQSHLKFIFRNHSDYTLLPADKFLGYADSSLAFNHKKFQMLDSGHFWLGPTPNQFNLGWKPALPRYVLWVKLKNLTSHTEFIFMGSHFDNRIENLRGSAKLLSDFVSKQNLPVIFAADTNITSDMPAYLNLTEYLISALDQLKKFKVDGVLESDKDLCYYRKGDRFPDCKVEHVLISKNSPWKTKDIIINLDTYRYKYPSDHRPFVIYLEEI